mmetsp:Transcript_50190/g.94006  ORF Transcript_50190/g.94006 Transcript_50190/m.94006 type:complete len:110 (-) Transcript_50190:144-473(-)
MSPSPCASETPVTKSAPLHSSSLDASSSLGANFSDHQADLSSRRGSTCSDRESNISSDESAREVEDDGECRMFAFDEELSLASANGSCFAGKGSYAEGLALADLFLLEV